MWESSGDHDILTADHVGGYLRKLSCLPRTLPAGGFPELGVRFQGVLVIRTAACEGQSWGPPIYGNCHSGRWDSCPETRTPATVTGLEILYCGGAGIAASTQGTSISKPLDGPVEALACRVCFT